MSIGEALAQARIRAGLTVEEVSMRSRIRAVVISAMENDDYEACGGAIYVNGYIRAIAAAVGIDPLPLIRAYAEGSKMPAPGQAGAGNPGTARGPGAANRLAAGGLASGPMPTREALADTVVDLPRVDEPQDLDQAQTPPYAQPAAERRETAPPPSLNDWLFADEAGSAMRQPAPPGPATHHRRPRHTRDRHWVRWQAVLAAVVLLVALGFAGREIFAGTHPGHLQSAAAENSVSAHPGAAPSRAPATTSPVRSRPSTPAAAQPAARSLTPVKAMAFGPAGTSDGDNPSTAYRAIRGRGQGWLSDWYTTSAFGALKRGTGLLVDMGTVVSITSVSLNLGRQRGAIVELRVGDEPVKAALHMVKQVTDAAGRVTAPLQAVKARYVLIWFTKLPPDGAGTYQANIDGIAVQGYR